MGNVQGRPESGEKSDDPNNIQDNRQSLNGHDYITEQQLHDWVREGAKPSIDALQRELAKLNVKVNGFTEDIESLKEEATAAESSERKTHVRNRTQLPKFSGNPEEWHYFRASFEITTAAGGFSDEENLIRLQESLEGPALENVRGLLMHPKLVPKVIESLDEIYGSPELLFVWHLKKIRALGNPTPKNIVDYEAFANAVRQLCDLVEASDMKQYGQDISLVNEFLLKMPDSQVSEWNSKDWQHNSVTLRKFCDFVQEKFAQARDAHPNKYRAALENKLPGWEPYTEESRSKKEKTSATTEQITKCRMCKRYGHPLWYCSEFKQLNVETREDLVTVWKVCKICLCVHKKKGRGKCVQNIRCNVDDCRKKHNTLLHPTKVQVCDLDSKSDNSYELC